MKVIDFEQAKKVVLENRAAGKIYPTIRTTKGIAKIKKYKENKKRQKLIEAIARLRK